jgi:glycosyltransferase involved in cell wall biosynthesis
MRPKVSVFVASYNAPNFVRSACRSILDQTFKDLELVVVDDGSNEETREVLREVALSDPRMRLIEAEHCGQIATLNHCIRACRGTYIARLDHDDISRPERIERQVAYLDANPDVIAVGTHVGKIDVEGRRTRNPRYRLTHWTTDPTARPPRVLFLMGPTLMARADALKAAGGFREAFRAAEDRDISWRLAAQGRTMVLREMLVDHRSHPNSLGRTQSKMQSFGGFLSDLSAVAAHYGKDESEALQLIDAGNDYTAAIDAYEHLLGDAYPVRTLVYWNLVKPRFLKLQLRPNPEKLIGKVLQHVLARPWTLFKLSLLPRLLRVGLYALRARARQYRSAKP